MERVILHCDLNCFFASVELLSHPELRHLPVAVCGDPTTRHGIILAKNEHAKRKGVKTAETIWQAQRKCPELVLLPAHREPYKQYSKLVNAIYARYTDLVEPFGIDESWLDVTGSLHLFHKSPKELADEIRETVKRELGLTLSVGVSFNKVFAKLGSDYKKPDATTVITEENFRGIVWPLPVTDLLYVGRAAASLLKKYDVTTIGGLAQFDRETLALLLGKQGGQLHDYANGIDRSAVKPAGFHEPPKSVGNGITFRRNLLGEDDIRTGVALIADSVAGRLRRYGLKCTTLQVTIRDPNFKDICRQRPLPAPTYVSRDLIACAMGLIIDSWDVNKAPIRALTLTGLNLLPESEAAEQLDLFSAAEPHKRDKREDLEKAMDAIRQKFGKEAIRSARGMDSDVVHEREPEEESKP
ncbi:MAG: DNA polymerase IV [Oscillospiraceae bacterium]|nr:DNA polymerase IV [Oscillospiraceae bacterium]